jgi:NCS2 family nucleobase:cation symporter-2
MPEALGTLLHSGILLTAVSAVLLNLFFNGYRREAVRAAKEMAMAAELH